MLCKVRGKRNVIWSAFYLRVAVDDISTFNDHNDNYRELFVQAWTQCACLAITKIFPSDQSMLWFTYEIMYRSQHVMWCKHKILKQSIYCASVSIGSPILWRIRLLQFDWFILSIDYSTACLPPCPHSFVLERTELDWSCRGYYGEVNCLFMQHQRVEELSCVSGVLFWL